MTHTIKRLRHDAEECRNLAKYSIMPEAREILLDMAREYDERAIFLKANGRGARLL